MVGGYVILTKKPLSLGENNMVNLYGSVENANRRFTEVVAAKKPILVTAKILGNLESVWIEFTSYSAGVFTLISNNLEFQYNTSNGVCTAAIRQ